MQSTEPTSAKRKLLEVAATLEQPFSAEDLVVAAWRAHPAQFGLRGFEQVSADNNKVLAFLMGRNRGMVNGQHLLEQVGKKLYRVTDIGRRELQSSASRRKRNDQEILIDRLEASVAVKKNEQWRPERHHVRRCVSLLARVQVRGHGGACRRHQVSGCGGGD
jgi:hypothetical protein